MPAMSERNRAGPFSSVAVSDGERGEGHPCKVVIHKGANCVTGWRNARCVVASTHASILLDTGSPLSIHVPRFAPQRRVLSLHRESSPLHRFISL